MQLNHGSSCYALYASLGVGWWQLSVIVLWVGPEACCWHHRCWLLFSEREKEGAGPLAVVLYTHQSSVLARIYRPKGTSNNS